MAADRNDLPIVYVVKRHPQSAQCELSMATCAVPFGMVVLP